MDITDGTSLIVGASYAMFAFFSLIAALVLLIVGYANGKFTDALIRVVASAAAWYFINGIASILMSIFSIFWLIMKNRRDNSEEAISPSIIPTPVGPNSPTGVILQSIKWLDGYENHHFEVYQRGDRIWFVTNPYNLQLDIMNGKQLGKGTVNTILSTGVYIIQGFNDSREQVLTASIKVYDGVNNLQPNVSGVQLNSELISLSNLFKEGLLSLEEYTSAKKRLLESFTNS